MLKYLLCNHAVVTWRPLFILAPALTKFMFNFGPSLEKVRSEVTTLGDDSDCNTAQCGVRDKSCLIRSEDLQLTCSLSLDPRRHCVESSGVAGYKPEVIV